MDPRRSEHAPGNSCHDAPIEGSDAFVAAAVGRASAPVVGGELAGKLDVLLVHGARSRSQLSETFGGFMGSGRAITDAYRAVQRFYSAERLEALGCRRLSRSTLVLHADTHELLLMYVVGDAARNASGTLPGRIAAAAVGSRELHGAIGRVTRPCEMRSKISGCARDNRRLAGPLGMKHVRTTPTDTHYATRPDADGEVVKSASDLARGMSGRICELERSACPAAGALRRALCNFVSRSVGITPGRLRDERDGSAGAIASSEGYVSLPHVDNSIALECVLFNGSEVDRNEGWSFLGWRAGVLVDLGNRACLVMVPGNDAHGTPYSDRHFRAVEAGLEKPCVGPAASSPGLHLLEPPHLGIGTVNLNKTTHMSKKSHQKRWGTSPASA